MKKVKEVNDVKTTKRRDCPLKAFSKKELFWFILSVLIIANAIIFLVLGLIDDYGDIRNSILATPNEGMKAVMAGIGFTWFGVITLILGSFILAFSLSSASKSEDREKEREARREQRLKAMEKKDDGIVLNFEGTTSAKEEDK